MAEPGALDAFIALATAFFQWNGSVPDSSGPPTLRAFQRARGDIALNGLRYRTGEREHIG